MKIINVLRYVMRARRGIKPAYKRSHVILTLIKLLKGPIGRISLSKELGIGEASSRTLLNRLRELGLIYVDNVAGAVLTDKGREVIHEFLNKVRLIGEVNLEGLINDNFSNYLAIIRNGIDLVNIIGGVLRLRDLFVRYGAEGAVILYYLNNEIYMPLPNELLKVDKEKPFYKELINLKLQDKDLILIALCRRNEKSRCIEIILNVVIDLLSQKCIN